MCTFVMNVLFIFPFSHLFIFLLSLCLPLHSSLLLFLLFFLVSVQEFKNVRAFQAANDLNIGNHTLTVGHLRSVRLTENRIPIIGKNGLLTDTNKFTFSLRKIQKKVDNHNEENFFENMNANQNIKNEEERGILSVQSIIVSEIQSDIDINGYELR